MDPRPFLNLAPERRLSMTLALRQALEVLQMNQVELGQWLRSEIEKNPLLELETPRCKKGVEIDAPSQPTLHEHLQNQIRDNFSSPEERRIAEIYLENLDERGFLCGPLESSEVLSVLQTFDPPGIFARDLQETFLLQLQIKGKKDSLAFQMVQRCFEDLLHGRYGAIKKRLGCSDINSATRELFYLSMRPASAFKQDPVTPIYPDLRIEKVQGGWTLELIEDELPKFQIRNDYLALELESKEERDLLGTFKTQAQWIFRSLGRRRKLLREIGKILLCKQASYLDQKGPLKALTIKELSEKLKVHESTLSRAFAGKYISTPRGIIPLRSLISAVPAANTARELLAKLIHEEEKQNPLTDEELAEQLKGKGFRLARRTIAKYRSQLKIGSAMQRKNLGW